MSGKKSQNKCPGCKGHLIEGTFIRYCRNGQCLYTEVKQEHGSSQVVFQRHQIIHSPETVPTNAAESNSIGDIINVGGYSFVLTPMCLKKA